MSGEDLGFVHVYQAAPQPGAPTLLLLHGTGGDEHDLLPLGGLLPGANLLSPRGKVLERGMPRFFRRLAEGVFDVDDVKRRANELADFIAAAAAQYGFDASQVYALGFSNGANIASAVMLARPGVLKGGVLLRAMVPFEPETPAGAPPLRGTRVLVSNGEQDPIVSAAETDRLARLLQRHGAEVQVHWQPSGHELMPGDFAAAKTWLQAINR
ncbi:MAG TPA: alpha/beta hydrolase [Vicinamibacterales bacterium]|nr:alpha/beta hydrolase [Vicinamibacterales bacterium]